MNYSIKEVSEKLNISSYTLRYYEKEELLRPVARDSRGARRYTDSDLGWISFVCRMRATGMSVANIRKYMSLCIQGNGTAPERRQIIQNQKDLIEAQINTLNNDLELVNLKLHYYDEIIMKNGEDLLNPKVK